MIAGMQTTVIVPVGATLNVTGGGSGSIVRLSDSTVTLYSGTPISIDPRDTVTSYRIYCDVGRVNHNVQLLGTVYPSPVAAITLHAGRRRTIYLPANAVLYLTGSGRGSINLVNPLGAVTEYSGSSISFGPFETLTEYQLHCDVGTINYRQGYSVGDTLTLTGPLTYTINAAPGTLVAIIGNVPTGVTPTITPNDGRLVVDGNRIVVGASESSVGTIALSVSATGANPASANIVVTEAGEATVPGYIANVASAPYAVYGAQRVVSGYSGPLFQLRRTSDGGTMDVIPPVSGDFADYVAIAAWAAGSALTVAVIYDQTDNERHLIQATVANQPSFDPSLRIGDTAPFLWDGQRSTVAGPVAKIMALTDQSFNRQNISVVDAQQREVSFSNNIDWMFADGSSDTITTSYASGYTAGITNLGTTGKVIRSGTISSQFPADTTATPRVSPDVTIETMGTSDLRALLIRGNYYTSTAMAVREITMTNLILGRQSGNINDENTYTYNSRTMRLGFALFPALSQADAMTIAESLRIAFAMRTTFDYRLIFTGDDIMEGSGIAMNGNIPNQLQPHFNVNAEVFNTALHGKTMADMYNYRRAFFSTLYTAGIPNVIFLQAGTNDLTSTDGVGTTTYNNYTTPLIAYLKGLGFKVVVCTLLPRTDAAFTTAMQTERVIYNGLVTTNSAGADYVLDLASNPVMGASDAPNDTTLYVDKMHPTKLGATWLAGSPGGAHFSLYSYYNAVQSVLGFVP